MDTPPEDSIFSVPIWKKSFRDPNATRVQMNPALAYSQGETKSQVQPIAVGVSMLLVAIAIVAGGAYTSRSSQNVSVQASVDMKHAIVGTIESIDRNTNSFVMSFESTQDPDLSDTNQTSWKVQLPPGEGFARSVSPVIKVCHSVPDIRGDVSKATNIPCEKAIIQGQPAVVEYLILKKDTGSMVAKKILVNTPK